MSEANKQIVEKINAAFMRGDTEGFLAECSDNLVWTMVGEKRTEGKTAIREWMSQMGEGCEPPVFGVDQMIADGDTVACYGDMTMKGEGGKEEEYSYCDVYQFAGGKVTELRSFIVKHKTGGEGSSSASA